MILSCLLKNTRPSQVIKTSIVVLLNCVLIVLVMYEICFAIVQKSVDIDTLYVFEKITTRFTSFSSLMVTIWRRQVLIEIFNRIKQQLDKSKPLKHIENFQRKLIYIWLVSIPTQLILIQFVFLIGHFVLTLSYDNLMAVVINCSVKALYSTFWTLPSMLIYTYTVYVIGMAREEFFANLELLNSSPKVVRSKWLTIVEVTNHFDCSFSFIPFLWYVNFFVSASTFVVATCSPMVPHFSITFIIMKWFFLFVNFAMSVVIVLILDYFNERAAQHVLTLESRLVEIKEPFVRMEVEWLRIDVKNNLELLLTGWNLFKLNKEFVLSFISTTITFSTMFLQMASSQIKMMANNNHTDLSTSLLI